MLDSLPKQVPPQTRSPPSRKRPSFTLLLFLLVVSGVPNSLAAPSSSGPAIYGTGCKL